MVVSALSLGCWRAWIAPYRDQEKAATAFKQAGGSASTRAIGPKPLRYLLGDERFQYVVQVDLRDCEVTDECLEWLVRLPRLESIMIGRYGPAMRPIDYRDGILNARYLNLSNTPVTDRGLAVIGRMNKLETLWLNDTDVTDEGLRHLEHLKSLRIVWLVDTKVTVDGVRRLRRSLPNTYVGFQ
jgi:hypothetical protein